MSFEKSEVMREFFKIMSEQETPAKNPYQEDKKVIEEKREFPKEDIVEKAHPEAVYVAESRGDGGLVENQNEQHEKMMSVINKMPTGNLLGTYASTVDSLVKLANLCDEAGDTESADKLTDAAKKVLALMDVLPFDSGTRVQDGEVSPLYKEAATILGLGKWIFNFAAGDGIKLAKAIGSKMGEVGIDVMSGLGKVWKALKGEKVVATKAGEVSKDVGKIFSETSTKSKDAVRAVADSIKNEIEETNKIFNRLQEVMERAKQATKDTKIITQIDSDLQLLENIKKMPASEAKESLNSLKHYSPAVTGISSASHALEAQERLTKVQSIQQQIVNSQSKNLSNDKEFFKEYLSLHKGGDNNSLGVWLLNPENTKKVTYLMNNPFRNKKLVDILEKGEIPLSNRLLGVTVEQQAKRIGVPVVAITGASAVAAISIYGWFDKNDPQNNISEIENEIKNPLNQVRAYGPGKNIIGRVKTSMDDIINLEKMADESLENNPQLLTKYISGMAEQLKILVDEINQWNLVEDSAEDKEIAKQTKQQIIEFLTRRVQSFNELAGIMGIPMTQMPRANTTESKADDNISKVQEFIKVPVTGVLDQATIKSLQALEQNFNKQSEDNRFTGLFVNPATNYVISYNELTDANNLIKKY